MSDWGEKFEQHAPATDATARRPWHTLRDVPTLKVLEGELPSPKLVSIRVMNVVTVWEREFGKSAGPAHLYRNVVMSVDKP